MSRIRVASARRNNGFVKVIIFKRTSKEERTSMVQNSDNLRKELSPVDKLIIVYKTLITSSLLLKLEENQRSN